MARIRRLKCAKCDRRFSMPAHLARHTSTVHASKATKKRARKKVAKRARRRVVRPAAAGPARAIHEIQAHRDRLIAQRAKLDPQIAAVEGALRALGVALRPPAGRAVRVGGGGGPRKGSLKDCIRRVLSARKGPMAVKDVTAAVLKAGHKSKNKTLDKSVGTTLTQMPKVVKVARGQYRLRRA